MYVVLAVIGLQVGPLALAAQQGTPRQQPTELRRTQTPAPSLTHMEIVARLRQAGVTRAQARARLTQLGEDPSLVDPYFDVIERAADPPLGSPSPEVLRVLRQFGIPVGQTESDAVMLPDSIPADSLLADSLATDSPAPGELPIFGRSLFQRATSQFQAITSGPVDPDYRLGPGDELELALAGDVEAAYRLVVTREGYVAIPDVGQVLVNGLTVREMEDRLHQRLGNVYSGVGRGAGAATQFQLSLGRLRSIQVFVIGEVERPGAYQVNALSTVFNALYLARGPTESGSFRRVEVRRGGTVIGIIDLYDYLLHGDSRSDIRLQHGDAVFVPIVGPQVGIQGAVRRSAVFELKSGDALRDLLQYAGGMEARAVVRRVQIDRILPPSQRSPGVDRVLVDVDVQELLSPDGAQIDLRDGDLV